MTTRTGDRMPVWCRLPTPMQRKPNCSARAPVGSSCLSLFLCRRANKKSDRYPTQRSTVWLLRTKANSTPTPTSVSTGRIAPLKQKPADPIPHVSALQTNRATSPPPPYSSSPARPPAATIHGLAPPTPGIRGTPHIYPNPNNRHVCAVMNESCASLSLAPCRTGTTSTEWRRSGRQRRTAANAVPDATQPSARRPADLPR